MKTPGSGESKLETIISYLLIIGVVVSLMLTVVGLIFFHSHGLSISLNDPAMFIQGQNFFSFIGGLASSWESQSRAIYFITLGIVILILTPYIRVIASFAYFGARKDIKYILITLYVLIVLTVSLTLH